MHCLVVPEYSIGKLTLSGCVGIQASLCGRVQPCRRIFTIIKHRQGRFLKNSFCENPVAIPVKAPGFNPAFVFLRASSTICISE